MFKRIAIALLRVASIAAGRFPNARAGQAPAKCKLVRGHAVSHTVSGSDCASPIGLCAGGQLYGGIKGELNLIATSLRLQALPPLRVGARSPRSRKATRSRRPQ
jgi:hypothetical protein